jgi:hypothetical protein
MWDAANESFQPHHDTATSYRAGKLASYGYGYGQNGGRSINNH